MEDAAWMILQSKLDCLSDSAEQTSFSAAQIADLLGHPKPTSSTYGISQSILSVPPHLANLQNKISADPYIAKTWALHQEYTKEKLNNSLIIFSQLQQLKDPISQAMWKLIVLDHFVDFNKLYATLDCGYDHNDEPKDFVGGFSLVKKDPATAK
ncbi:hypothetical protein C0989_006690 [Termitomyces sp. Mn162]|nr:hypothetical protein C0989_006690 [Termitomyces sp. Mn162]